MVPLRAHLALGLLISTVLCVAARSDDSSPNQVLKRLGVKRSSSSYILAEETTVRGKLNEVRTVRQRLFGALQQQREMEQLARFNRLEIRRLAGERLLLNQQLAAAGEGLSVQDHNRLVAMINTCSDQIKELESEVPDASTKRQIDTEISLRRGAFIQAVLDLRKLVDKTSQKYTDLAQDEELQKAMAAREPKAKSPVKLGPSSDFKNSSQQLQNLEKLVLTDTIAVVPRGGVYEVQVTLNDKLTRPFVYDTGAAFLTVSSDVAAELGLAVASDDPTIRLELADGTVIEGKQKTIPSVRLGKFTVNDVECAVMPTGKSKSSLLLGQSVLRHFTVSGSLASGQLVLSKIGGQDAQPNGAAQPKADRRRRRGVR